MATIQPKVYEIPGGAAVGVRIRWEGMSTGDVGAPISKVEYPWKTIQITGELQDGDLEGTNTPEDGDSWMALKDDDTEADMTRPGLYYIKLNPLAIRPSVRQGEHVAFDMICTR